MRELKTVHFDVTTKLLRLVFYDPFQHRENIFQQVGLVSLVAIGEQLGDYPQEPTSTIS